MDYHGDPSQLDRIGSRSDQGGRGGINGILLGGVRGLNAHINKPERLSQCRRL